jgi:hypothetical protein
MKNVGSTVQPWTSDGENNFTLGETVQLRGCFLRGRVWVKVIFLLPKQDAWIILNNLEMTSKNLVSVYPIDPPETASAKSWMTMT